MLDDLMLREAYEFVKDWQTLFGALIALGAALLALRPVWGQLSELKRQSEQRSYELLSARTVTLHQEQQALYKLTSSLEIMLSALSDFLNSNPIAGITPMAVANIQASEAYLKSTIEEFKSELGPVWGSAEVQQARKTMLGEALRFANDLTAFTARVTIGNRIGKAEVENVSDELAERMRVAFDAAEIVHCGIETELARVSKLITDLESRLLS